MAELRQQAINDSAQVLNIKSQLLQTDNAKAILEKDFAIMRSDFEAVKEQQWTKDMQHTNTKQESERLEEFCDRAIAQKDAEIDRLKKENATLSSMSLDAHQALLQWAHLEPHALVYESCFATSEGLIKTAVEFDTERMTRHPSSDSTATGLTMASTDSEASELMTDVTISFIHDGSRPSQWGGRPSKPPLIPELDPTGWFVSVE